MKICRHRDSGTIVVVADLPSLDQPRRNLLRHTNGRFTLINLALDDCLQDVASIAGLFFNNIHRCLLGSRRTFFESVRQLTDNVCFDVLTGRVDLSCWLGDG